MTNFFLGYNSIYVPCSKLQKELSYSFNEILFSEDGKREETVTCFLFKTERSFYIRFKTSIIYKETVVITIELGKKLIGHPSFDYDKRGIKIVDGIECQSKVIDPLFLKENSKYTRKADSWKNLKSYIQHSKNKLGKVKCMPLTFNPISDLNK